MGDSISEGTVSAILKQPGSAVQTDEVIAQIETDKVTIDVLAPESGTVQSIAVGLVPSLGVKSPPPPMQLLFASAANAATFS